MLSTTGVYSGSSDGPQTTPIRVAPQNASYQSMTGGSGGEGIGFASPGSRAAFDAPIPRLPQATGGRGAGSSGDPRKVDWQKKPVDVPRA